MRYMTLSIPARIAVHDFINDSLVDKALYRISVDGPGPGPGPGPGAGRLYQSKVPTYVAISVA